MGKTSYDRLLSDLLAKVKGTEHEGYLVEMRERYIFLLDRMGRDLSRGDRVLDAGSSPGLFTQLMRGAGYEASGIDLHPDKRFPPAVGNTEMNLFLDLGIPVVKSDIVNEPFPFRNEAFDAVMMNETIEHLFGSPLPCMKEIRRVLKPGGLLYMTTPNVSQLANRIKFLFGQNIYTPVEVLVNVPPYKCHSREYTMSDLVDLVERAGFSIVDREFYNFRGRPRGGPWDVARKLYYAATAVMPSGKSNLFIAAVPGL